MDEAFGLDNATNVTDTFFKMREKQPNPEYCLMSRALDLIVQIGLKVEEYFCSIPQLSTVILGLDFCIIFSNCCVFF